MPDDEAAAVLGDFPFVDPLQANAHRTFFHGGGVKPAPVNRRESDRIKLAGLLRIAGAHLVSLNGVRCRDVVDGVAAGFPDVPIGVAAALPVHRRPHDHAEQGRIGAQVDHGADNAQVVDTGIVASADEVDAFEPTQRVDEAATLAARHQFQVEVVEGFVGAHLRMLPMPPSAV